MSGLVGCATVSGPVALVELNQDSSVTLMKEEGSIGTPKPAKKQKGEVVEIKQLPVLFEAPGRIGVLLVPIQNLSQKIKLALRPWDGNFGTSSSSDTKPTQDTNSIAINELLVKTNRIQTWLVEKKTHEALALIDELVTQYPQVSQLKFLKVSCLVLMNERKKAKALLDLALKGDPSNQSGRELLQFLSPGSTEPRKGE